MKIAKTNTWLHTLILFVCMGLVIWYLDIQVSGDSSIWSWTCTILGLIGLTYLVFGQMAEIKIENNCLEIYYPFRVAYRQFSYSLDKIKEIEVSTGRSQGFRLYHRDGTRKSHAFKIPVQTLIELVQPLTKLGIKVTYLDMYTGVRKIL